MIKSLRALGIAIIIAIAIVIIAIWTTWKDPIQVNGDPTEK